MTSPEIKKKTVEEIKAAMKDGARLSSACKILDISVRTYQRWKSGALEDKRKGAEKKVPRKLSETVKETIVRTCCNDTYKDDNPYTIFIDLLEKGIYYASISTFYRILREHKLIKKRSNKKARGKRNKPEEGVAKGPNEVWCWDITWLQTSVKGIFKYAYTIIDIWDKSIIGWEIHDNESQEHSESLFKKVLAEQGYPNVHIHSDNGKPMKGVSLLAWLSDLGCKNTFSRPRVSNDNPFIESFFGTMKTRINYPGKFNDLSEARGWMAEFVNFYNNQHRHSGIYYFTPQQMRNGSYKSIVENRNKAMLKAYNNNPERWSSKPKQWPKDHTVVLNPSLYIQPKKNQAA